MSYADRHKKLLTASESVNRAAYAGRPTIEDMGIDHRRRYVAMTQDLLNRPYSYPPSSKWVAREWRKVWHVARLVKPAFTTAHLDLKRAHLKRHRLGNGHREHIKNVGQRNGTVKLVTD